MFDLLNPDLRRSRILVRAMACLGAWAFWLIVCATAYAQAPFATPNMTMLPAGPPPFEYSDVGTKIPNYVPSDKWGQQGEPLRKMQKPLAPADSLRRMVVPTGFHVELFAAEPELDGKPICMSWDERGRLWVGETVDYPNELQPQNQGRDRIRICDDTDGDGRADKFTIFAEHLSIPTSIAFARGGVIVHNGTETVFLKDTNGDDRADEREVLLASWSLGDTHGGPSNMQYGLDNWIWGMQGYNKSTIRIADKSTYFAQGFHRFRSDGSAIEFIRSTNNNTWGLGMSEEGIIFGSTANGCPSVYMPIANRYYERVRGWTPQLTLSSIAESNRIRPITDKIRQVDHHGGYTAAAGHALYTARTYPQPYWNRVAFVCEPTGHLVSMMMLSAEGADFHATSPANLLASDDEWVAPIMAEVGPDGCVWVIDWYNYIVQHNPTPEGFETGKGAAYESDLRDKRHGRIYRIVYDSVSRTPTLDLTHATPSELVATLGNSNLFWRRHAQRLLVERGQLDVMPQLLELVSDKSVDEIGLNVGAIHALWTLHGLGALNGSQPNVTVAAVAALRHPSAGVRRNAVQTLSQDGASTAAILEAGLLEDPAVQVRLQALLALSDLHPNAAAGHAVAECLNRVDNAEDRWMVDAVTCAGAANSIDFLIASAKTKKPTPQLLDVCRFVANHFARSSPGASTERLFTVLATAKPRIAGAIIDGLDKGWPTGSSLPNNEMTRGAVKQLLLHLPIDEQVRLARLAARGGDKEMTHLLSQLTEELFTQVSDETRPMKDRITTADLMIAAQPENIQLANRLLDLITPQAPTEFNHAAIRALHQCNALTMNSIVSRINGMTPATREAVFDLLLSRQQLADELLVALEQGTVKLSDLSLIQKQRLSEYPDRSLRERAQSFLAKGQENINADRKQILAEFTDVANVGGDAAAGKALFTKNCAACHRYQGEGVSVGPDLTGMGVHGKQQLLVHILDPSRDIEGNYQAYVVVLTDGRVLNGMLGGESGTSIELIDGEGKRHPILREEIDQLTRTGKSFMPEGFEKQLTRTEISNVLEFLTQRGQFVPLDLHRAATVTSFSGMFQTPGSEVERLVFDDWGVKTVAAVPFYPIDPQEGRVRNVIMLHGDLGTVAPNMPKTVQLPCGLAAKVIHFLGGISGWGFPATKAGTVSMIIRLHYTDGQTEDHPLINGVHIADYLGRTEVSDSKLAFSLGRQQIRYFKIEPKRSVSLDSLELIKGEDRTAPVIMSITAELLVE